MYIKVKNVETSKYDLSYMRYYIVIAIGELINFFGPPDDLNEKVINYKVLDLVILYNFDIKLDFIPRSYEKVMNFSYGTICRDGPCHLPPPKNAFVGTGEAMTRPYKCHHF